MPTNDDVLEKLFYEVGLRSEELTKGLKGAEKELEGFSDKSKKILEGISRDFDKTKKDTAALKERARATDKETEGLSRLQVFGGAAAAGIGAVVGAATAAGGAIALFTKQGLAMGQAINKASAQLGISTEEFTKLRFATRLTSTDMGQLGRGMTRLEQNVIQAATATNSKLGKAFKALNIDAKQLAKLPVAQQLKRVSTIIAELPSRAQKAQISRLLFGEGGEALLPLLERGATGIEALGDEAERLGIVLDSVDSANIKAATDTFERLSTVMEAIRLQLAAELAPAITTIGTLFINSWNDNNGFIRETVTLIGELGLGFASIGLRISTLATRLSIFWTDLQIQFNNARIAFFNLLAPIEASVRDLIISILQQVETAWNKIAALTREQWVQTLAAVKNIDLPKLEDIDITSKIDFDANISAESARRLERQTDQLKLKLAEKGIQLGFDTAKLKELEAALIDSVAGVNVPPPGDKKPPGALDLGGATAGIQTKPAAAIGSLTDLQNQLRDVRDLMNRLPPGSDLFNQLAVQANGLKQEITGIETEMEAFRLSLLPADSMARMQGELSMLQQQRQQVSVNSAEYAKLTDQIDRMGHTIQRVGVTHESEFSKMQKRIEGNIQSMNSLFSGLERNISQTIQTGKFNLDSFLNTIKQHFANEAARQLMLPLRQGFEEIARSGETSSQSIGGSFQNVFSQIGTGATSLVTMLLKSFSGLATGVGNVLGGIGSAIGSLFTGGSAKTATTSGGGSGSGAGAAIGGAVGSVFGPVGTVVGGIIGGLFAEGGSPPVGIPSVVGERGPELFVPKQAGNVVSNKEFRSLTNDSLAGIRNSVGSASVSALGGGILGLLPGFTPSAPRSNRPRRRMRLPKNRFHSRGVSFTRLSDMSTMLDLFGAKNQGSFLKGFAKRNRISPDIFREFVKERKERLQDVDGTVGKGIGTRMLMGFAGGGFTGAGSRSGGLDGQGGFMAMLHPQETVIDHRSAPMGGGSVVSQPITINQEFTSGVTRAELSALLPSIQQQVMMGVSDGVLRGGGFSRVIRG